MTKQKRLKSILLLTLSILMLAIMAIFPLVNNASAEETTAGQNLFDMTLFEPVDVDSFRTFVYTDGVICKITGNDNNSDKFYYSGYMYLPANTYTLSFVYNGIDVLEFLDVSLYSNTTSTNIIITENGFVEKTFTVNEATTYRFYIILQNITLLNGQIEYFSFNNIMLNVGETALPFTPYIEINDEIGAIIQGSNNIIDKLDDLFGTNSGLIAGASLGTVVLLLFLLYVLLRRR